jgi:hypothetical protein
MARQQAVVRPVAFSQLDELTREISKLAVVVNARFVVDATKLKELKSSGLTPANPKRRLSRN